MLGHPLHHLQGWSCDGDSDKCCCGDHLLSEGYRNTEESQSVLRTHLTVFFSNFILIEALLSLGLIYKQNRKVEEHLLK